MPNSILIIILTIAMVLAYLIDCTVQMLYYVHMLQLNSYRGERYRKWMWEKRRELINRSGWMSVSVIAAGFYPLHTADWRVLTVCIIIFALHAAITRPKPAKKPLVYTARVKRLLVTGGVMTAAVAAAVIATAGVFRIELSALFLWVSIFPFVVMLANTVNLPMENAISRGYVNDARSILSGMNHLTVIGITGSYGKTTTKNYLHALLSLKYNTLMTPESYNTTMGVVRTIRERLTPAHEVFIAEMGAKNIGDIKEICELVHPKYGMITSIGEQHLETFGSVENVIRTKFELAEAVPTDGAAFLNFDNEYIAHRDVTCRAITYSVSPDSTAAYRATDIAVGQDGSTFTVTAPSGEIGRFSTKLLGAHAIQNITGCIAVAHTLGIPLSELTAAVRRLQPVPHRLQLLPNGYIDDAYNSNPAGFRAALDVLSSFDGQRVLVTPGMVELGDRQNTLNREVGEYAATRCDYAVLVGEKQAPPLLEGLQNAGFDSQRIFVAKNLAEGLEYVNSLPGGVPRTVLLENDLPDNF